jgi:hypothetical protein
MVTEEFALIAGSAAEGTLWADATSARETEASSAPIRFTYRP